MFHTFSIFPVFKESFNSLLYFFMDINVNLKNNETIVIRCFYVVYLINALDFYLYIFFSS